MKELLIDGDILLYQYGCTNQTVIDWGDGIKSEWSELDRAIDELESFLKNLLQQTSTSSFTICFSSIDPPSFRYKILPTYKHNRIGKEKPKLYYDIRRYCLDNYPCKVESELEADDLLGLLATEYPNKYIVCSIDKDMKQIPGEHFNWRTGKKFKITESQADEWFYTQILTGDTVDGYTGCPGIGPKKALQILGYKETWKAILKAYESKCLTEQEALVQARVARILRKGEYDFGTKALKLWTPEVIR